MPRRFRLAGDDPVACSAGLFGTAMAAGEL
jgi:hypothetical protein